MDYYLLYPIRWLLRHRVAKWRNELDNIMVGQMVRAAKSRRTGATMWTWQTQMRAFLRRDKLERLIKRWGMA